MLLPKILIVDDETALCDDIANFLKMKGYVVVCAHTGKQALCLVVVERPDLVLLDIHMPEMDGIECLGKIKEVNPELPVIMVTCVTDIDIARKAMKMGAVDYLTKPINLEALELAIMTNIFLHSARN